MRGIVFDADHTLIDFNADAVNAYERLCARCGARADLLPFQFKGCGGKMQPVSHPAKAFSEQLLCPHAFAPRFLARLPIKPVGSHTFPAVMAAYFAPVTASRSAGASSTWAPMRPALTMMVSLSSAEASTTVTKGFFMPTGLQPPRT